MIWTISVLNAIFVIHKCFSRHFSSFENHRYRRRHVTSVLMNVNVCSLAREQGKCQRRDPPCKYLHPPQHLKEQLLQNGRNNLILKHLQMQMMAHAIPGVYPIVRDNLSICCLIEDDANAV